MTQAQSYLRQAYITQLKIRRLDARLEQLRSDLYSVRSAADMDVDRVQTSLSGDSMLRLIAKVDKAERAIIKERIRLINQQTRIANQIEQLPDERHRQVLTYRYILFEKWKDIATRMHLDERWIYRLHGQALKAFDQMYFDQ